VGRVGAVCAKPFRAANAGAGLHQIPSKGRGLDVPGRIWSELSPVSPASQKDRGPRKPAWILAVPCVPYVPYRKTVCQSRVVSFSVLSVTGLHVSMVNDPPPLSGSFPRHFLERVIRTTSRTCSPVFALGIQRYSDTADQCDISLMTMTTYRACAVPATMARSWPKRCEAGSGHGGRGGKKSGAHRPETDRLIKFLCAQV